MGRLLVALVVCGASVLGQSRTEFTVADDWAHLPDTINDWGPLASVAPDRRGGIVVLRRSFPSFLTFRTDGTFLDAWGREGLLSGSGAHGVRVDTDGNLWVTDTQYHLVYKLSSDGAILLVAGRKGVAGDNRSPDAFNRPADVAVAPNGDFFVADGYGNSRVVKFSKDGTLLKIIGGTKGSAPGQFDLVHSVVIDKDRRLLVGDRNNARVQVFDLDGTFIEAWTGLGKPYGMSVAADGTLYVADADGGTITISKNGRLVQTIEDLGRPHWVGVDEHGAIYMADVRGFVKRITRSHGSQ